MAFIFISLFKQGTPNWDVRIDMYYTFHNHCKIVSSSINTVMPSPLGTTNISSFGTVFSHSTTHVHSFNFFIYPKIIFIDTFFLVVLKKTKNYIKVQI
jgi:hypothetical protein